MNIFIPGPNSPGTVVSYAANYATVIHNFEQVYGMVKLGEVSKLFIHMDVWNFYDVPGNAARGQRAAEKIHALDPTIPILIWDGRKYEQEDSGLEVFCLEGDRPWPIKYDNELYVPYDGGASLQTVIRKFYAGTLTEKDCPGYVGSNGVFRTDVSSCLGES